MSASKATPVPEVETEFGGDAVQPLQPPLFFNIGADQRNFEAQLGPWRLNRDQIVSKMLMRDAAQVKSDTFDSIFKFDLDDLRRKAACDSIRDDQTLQADVSERMNNHLDQIE